MRLRLLPLFLCAFPLVAQLVPSEPLPAPSLSQAEANVYVYLSQSEDSTVNKSTHFLVDGSPMQPEKVWDDFKGGAFYALPLPPGKHRLKLGTAREHTVYAVPAFRYLIAPDSDRAPAKACPGNKVMLKDFNLEFAGNAAGRCQAWAFVPDAVKSGQIWLLSGGYEYFDSLLGLICHQKGFNTSINRIRFFRGNDGNDPAHKDGLGYPQTYGEPPILVYKAAGGKSIEVDDRVENESGQNPLPVTLRELMEDITADRINKLNATTEESILVVVYETHD